MLWVVVRGVVHMVANTLDMTFVRGWSGERHTSLEPFRKGNLMHLACMVAGLLGFRLTHSNAIASLIAISTTRSFAVTT